MNKKHDFGYYIGKCLSYIFIVCIMTVIVALTAKFIIWLF